MSLNSCHPIRAGYTIYDYTDIRESIIVLSTNEPKQLLRIQDHLLFITHHGYMIKSLWYYYYSTKQDYEINCIKFLNY